MDDVNLIGTVTDAEFRAVMSGHPSGVVIVTTTDREAGPMGLTCSSMSSVSLAPPLLLVCVANYSRTLSAVRASGAFAVNMLHHEGRITAQAFAGGAADRFGSVHWAMTASGLPYLPDDAFAVAECALHTAIVAGDHTIVVGEVRAARVLASTAPLLYGRHRYAAWPCAQAG